MKGDNLQNDSSWCDYTCRSKGGQRAALSQATAGPYNHMVRANGGGAIELRLVRDSAERRQWVAVTACVLLSGAVLRLHNLARIPPGLQHDEVFKGMFAEMVLKGARPVFFDMNYGNEPLFVYLVSLAARVFGLNVISLRLPAVAGGLLCLACGSWALRTLFGRQVAALSTLLMSVSLWHILDSRVSLRAIWLPALMLMAYGLLWRWLRRGGRWWLLFSGVCLGLALYTYTSAALSLFTVAAFACYLWLVARNGRTAAGLVVAIGIAMLVGLPLIHRILTVPDSFPRVRVLGDGVAALLSGDPLPVASSACKTLGMFAFVGDPEWRYNVAGRPVFWFGLGVVFYVGGAVVVRQWKRPEYAFLLLWLVINLAATAVTSSAPSSLRAVGAAPAVYATAAIGCRAVLRWLQRYGHIPRALAVLVVAIIVTCEAVDGITGYFVTWTRSPQVREIYRADIAEVGRYLRAHPFQGEVMISAEYASDLDRQALEYLGLGAEPARWFDGQTCLVLPSGPTMFVMPKSRPLAPELRSFLPQLGARLEANDQSYESWVFNGGPAVDVKPAVAVVAAPWSSEALRLFPARIPDQVVSGEELDLLLRWSVTAPPPGGQYVTFFAHLVDEAGFIWAQDDVLAYPTSDWRPGDEVLQLLRLQIPTDMPPVQAAVRVGVYQSPGRPMSITTIEDNLPFWSLDAGKVQIVQKQTAGAEQVDVELRLDVQSGDDLLLLGASVAPRVLVPGAKFEVSLWWEMGPGRDQSADISFALQREGNRVALPSFSAPFALNPHSGPVMVRERFWLRVPGDAERGLWRIVALDKARDTWIDLGEVFVSGIERSYELPDPECKVDAQFACGARLLGATVDKAVVGPGQDILVDLFWLCENTMDDSYTVFLHLSNAGGVVVTGHDSLPGGGDRRTTGWLPGEVVVDRHQLRVPDGTAPGKYVLTAGLYRADVKGYPRVPVHIPHEQMADEVVISEIEVH